MALKYQFNLPDEQQVIQRNRTITTYYAQLYQREPQLYKWAGMAAFASFHIGEKLSMWNWKYTKIRTLSETCDKKNSSLEDDFQLIRILNNLIFSEIGTALLMFSQTDFSSFRRDLIERGKDELIIEAFDKLHEARCAIEHGIANDSTSAMVWDANIQILWHEQSKVVQPLFDKLSFVFAGAMSLIASFDYSVNHNKTTWIYSSRFILFMITKGLFQLYKHGPLPDVTNIDQRWYWINNDILVRWRKVELRKSYITQEIGILSSLESRQLNMMRLIPPNESI